MKKGIMSILLLSTALTSVEARNFDERIKDVCEYYLFDNGRYNDVVAGYTMGIVAGIKSMIPVNERSVVSRKSLGYITDKACLHALNNNAEGRFEQKFKHATYKLMHK